VVTIQQQRIMTMNNLPDQFAMILVQFQLPHVQALITLEPSSAVCILTIR
jgi:hypothetical protein